MNSFECKECCHKVASSSGLRQHVSKKHCLLFGDYRKKHGILTDIEAGVKCKSLARWPEEAYKRRKEAKEKKISNRSEIEALGLQALKCRFCNFESMVSLIFHIVEKHDLSVKAYMMQHQGDKLHRNIPTASKLVAEKLRNRHLTDPAFHQKIVDALPPFPSKIEFWTSRGYSENDAIAQVSARQRAIAYMGGEEKLKKLSAASTGDRNPMSLASIASRHGVSRAVASTLTPCFGRSAEKHPMFGNHHTQEALEKIANSSHLRHPNKRSTPEIRLFEWCKKHFECDIINNVGIDKWNVDILFKEKKLIVEFFGDFWHMNPNIFDENYVNQITKLSAKTKRAADKLKIEHLQTIGYNVIIVWESDWKEHPNREKERIINAYNRTL